MGVADKLNFDNYASVATTTHLQLQLETFIEVYLEDYHVAPVSPAGGFVTRDDLAWQFAEALQRANRRRI